jgi:hypothetical protein
MRLIGNDNKFCLVLGGGERLRARTMTFRSYSATFAKPFDPASKRGRAPGTSAGLPPGLIC